MHRGHSQAVYTHPRGSVSKGLRIIVQRAHLFAPELTNPASADTLHEVFTTELSSCINKLRKRDFYMDTSWTDVSICQTPSRPAKCQHSGWQAILFVGRISILFWKPTRVVTMGMNNNFSRHPHTSCVGPNHVTFLRKIANPYRYSLSWAISHYILP